MLIYRTQDKTSMFTVIINIPKHKINENKSNTNTKASCLQIYTHGVKLLEIFLVLTKRKFCSPSQTPEYQHNYTIDIF